MFKKFLIAIFLVFILFLIGLGIYENQLGILSSDGKQSILQKLHYDITILPDGSALVEESRTYDFVEGEFSRGFLEVEGFVDQVTVFEDEVLYEQLDSLDSNRPEGYFAVEASELKTRIEWYYHVNDKESKNFKIKYRVPKVATLYNDCVDYFQKYVSSDNVYKIMSLSVNVNLPEGANSSNTKIWAHGPVGGKIEFDDDNTVKLAMKKVPPGEYIEARFLMPVDVLISTDSKISVDRYNELYEMESEASDTRDRETRFNGIILLIYLCLSGMIIILPIYSVAKYHIKLKRCKPELEPTYYRDLPYDLYPAELDYLMNHYSGKENTSLQISGTLLDLIYKGIIRAEVIANPGHFGKKTDTYFSNRFEKGTSVAKHEELLLNFLFKKVSGGKNSFSLRDLKKYCSNKKTATIANQFFLDFKEKVKTQVNNRHYFEFERNAHPKSFKIYLITYILLMILPMILMNKIEVLTTTPIYYVSIASFIGFMIIAIFGGKVKKLLTQLGENQYALWKAFKNFLSDFTTFDKKELPELFMWEKYLVYATVLNVSQKLLKQLFARYPEITEMKNDSRLLYLLGSYNYQDAYSQLNDIGNVFHDAMKDTMNIASKASKGSGGGFSSGGSDSGSGAGGSSGGVD